MGFHREKSIAFSESEEGTCYFAYEATCCVLTLYQYNLPPNSFFRKGDFCLDVQVNSIKQNIFYYQCIFYFLFLF